MHSCHAGYKREDCVDLACYILFAIKIWRLTDDFGSHLFSLLGSKGWGETARNDIDEDLDGELMISFFFLLWGLETYWLRGKSLHRRFEKILRLHALNEAHVGTSVGRKLQSGNGFVHAEYLRRVRASNDDKV